MASGKFNLDELKKAIAYMEANTAEINLAIRLGQGAIEMSGLDRKDQEVTLTIYDVANHMLPKKKVTTQL